jgi:hypothetical protein
MVVHACNPITQEVEAKGFQIQSQPRLHYETVSKKKKKKNFSNVTWITGLKYTMQLQVETLYLTKTNNLTD